MSNFAVDISKFAEKVKDRQDLVMRKIVLELYNKIVQKTPVDTGRAQNNWNVGISTIDPTVTQEAVSNKQAVIQKAQKIISKIKGGDTIWITNNLNYITGLEDGSSDQAPAGMVAVTVREHPHIVNKSVTEAKRERP